MVVLSIVILSALVVTLSGAVVILSFRLHAAKKNQEETAPPPIPAESTQVGILRQKRERVARLCRDLKRSLTHICTTIPSSIPGLSIERVRLLCADELKDQVNAVSNAFQHGLPDRLAPMMRERDFELLDECIDQLSSNVKTVKEIDLTLEPVLKTWSGNSTATFDVYVERLTSVYGRFDELQNAVRSLLSSIAQTSAEDEAKPSVQKRIQKVSGAISDPKVRAAMADLETLARQHYDALDRQVKARVESCYLETLELVLGELGRAEQAGEDTSTRAALSLRVIHVLSNVIASGQQVQCEISERKLEAEVVALERLTALRGDAAQ